MRKSRGKPSPRKVVFYVRRKGLVWDGRLWRREGTVSPLKALTRGKRFGSQGAAFQYYLGLEEGAVLERVYTDRGLCHSTFWERGRGKRGKAWEESA